ncbi:MAG: DnaB-like helicase C-terminal domain-containing protein [Planctomycetota bacterium]|jgi:replicative DNA helicase
MARPEENGKQVWRPTPHPTPWGNFLQWLVTSRLKIATGIPTFDRAMAGGLQEGWLVSVVGVDQSGKSNFVLTCALNAIAAGHTVGVINLDMDWHLWYLRILAQIGNVNASEILEKEQFEFGEQEKLVAVMEKVQCFPGALVVDDSMPTTIRDVRASIDALAKDGAKLVIVDYLQLIEADHSHGNYVTAFDEVVKGVRRSARENSIPLLCCGQLNRKAKEDDEGPQIYHTLGGTALERHGDINLVIDHRGTQLGDGVESFKVNIAKNRPVGRLFKWDMRFDRKTLSLSELTSEWQTSTHPY